jgi:electron transfer flavoprotein beta subunit
LLTIQSGNSKLRYATLMGIKRAKTKEVRRVPAAPASAPAVTLEKVMLPTKQRSTQILAGSPAEAAAALVEKLQFEVRAI